MAVATKTQPLDKQKALKALNRFLDQYKVVCNQKGQPKAADFSEIISANFQNSSNGKVIGKNLPDFLKRIQDVQQKYSSIEVVRPKDCLISDNKAIVQYDLNLTTKEGKKVQVNVMAIATIEDDLITQWSQVSHFKD